MAQTPAAVAQMPAPAVIQAAKAVKIILHLAVTEQVQMNMRMSHGMALTDTISSNMGMNHKGACVMCPEGVWSGMMIQIVKEITADAMMTGTVMTGATVTGRMVSLQEQSLWLLFQVGVLPARLVYPTATNHTVDRTSKLTQGKAAGSSLH